MKLGGYQVNKKSDQNCHKKSPINPKNSKRFKRRIKQDGRVIRVFRKDLNKSERQKMMEEKNKINQGESEQSNKLEEGLR